MISPRVDELLEHVDSNYASVIVAAKRARQINSLLPQPRRGHVRRVPAADGRDRLEELPDDRPRGSRRGQDQVPLPRSVSRQAPRMARILLGVTRRDRRLQGARARRAWRPRPATRCASIQTPASRALRRRGVVRGASPARRCSSTSSSATRRAAPSPASRRPTHEPISATSSWSRNADVFLIAPASANTIAKLAAGLADNLLTERRARRDVPAASSRRR